MAALDLRDYTEMDSSAAADSLEAALPVDKAELVETVGRAALAGSALAQDLAPARLAAAGSAVGDLAVRGLASPDFACLDLASPHLAYLGLGEAVAEMAAVHRPEARQPGSAAAVAQLAQNSLALRLDRARGSAQALVLPRVAGRRLGQGLGQGLGLAREWRFAALPYRETKAPQSEPDLSVLARSLSYSPRKTRTSL